MRCVFDQRNVRPRTGREESEDVVNPSSTYLQNAAEYAARTQYAEFPGTSFKIADVRSAVDSTKCGQLPLCIHTDT